MLTLILVLMAIISGILHIRAEYQGPRWQVYVFKPLTMTFILAGAVFTQPLSSFYKYMIITGLVFSLAGDVFLMLPRDLFLAGLGAFLFAHIFYISAFLLQVNGLNGWLILPFILYGAIIYYFLSPFVGKLKFPVFLYIFVILVMAWFAWIWWWQTFHIKALLAMVGALLFVVSDTILAFNRFRRPFKTAGALILSTYFTAQLLISSSI